MNSLIYTIAAACSLLIARPALAELQFTGKMPECKSPKGRNLPSKYYRYEWAKTVTRGDSIVGGNAEKKFDDPDEKSYLWHKLVKADINSDGWCDWIVTSSFPLSAGGDRNSINTFYLGTAEEWKRRGADLKGGQNIPDGLGFTKSIDQENLFNFFESVGFLYEKTERRMYLIGMFADRHIRQYQVPGYHIYFWDNKKNSLVELEKSSKKTRNGGQAYAYFKKHGASTGDMRNPIFMFESDVEKLEFTTGR
jgi:hypothetical protein